jgi:hypothetical protein
MRSDAAAALGAHDERRSDDRRSGETTNIGDSQSDETGRRA